MYGISLPRESRTCKPSSGDITLCEFKTTDISKYTLTRLVELTRIIALQLVGFPANIACR